MRPVSEETNERCPFCLCPADEFDGHVCEEWRDRYQAARDEGTLAAAAAEAALRERGDEIAARLTAELPLRPGERVVCEFTPMAFRVVGERP